MLLFLACAGVPEAIVASPAAEVTPTPASETEEPVVVPATPEVRNTPIPVPTATPVPTDTPEPTPTPSPTPVPYDAELESQRRAALLVEADHLDFVSTRGNNPAVLSEPQSGTDRIYPFHRSDAIYQYEWIVLEQVDTKFNSFYHVRAIGADAEGYINVNSVNPSQLRAPESTYAMMVRPNGLIYCGRTTDATIVAHANYAPLRVFGVDDRFAMVVTPEGKTGYAELGQIQFVDQETFDAYLHQSCETSDARFDREALPELGMEYIDEPYENPAEFVYALLSRAGLHFNDVYYRYYQKPLDRTDLYPHSLYRDAVYNTLMFKLFNSSGQHVTSNGNETEWAYIHNYEDLEPGDLVFFCDTTGKGDAVVKHVEVVIHGDYSGDVTDCGVYLGEDRMLTVRKGKVCELAIDPVMQYEFDSARRIYPSIVDEKAHFIENMIAAIYDRLGTPYSNAKRVGDASYDCSGIINWVLRGYDYNEFKNPSTVPIEITAASFGHLEVLYSPKNELHFVDTGVHERDEESLSKLERGDLVLLLNESRTRIGHIMCYLGDMTVIHSTRIEGNYRGTLVAKFRNHLQGLYASSIRIDSFVPVQ